LLLQSSEYTGFPTDFTGTLDNNIDVESDSGIVESTEDTTDTANEISTPGPGEQGHGSSGARGRHGGQRGQRGNVAHQHQGQEVGSEVAPVRRSNRPRRPQGRADGASV